MLAFLPAFLYPSLMKRIVIFLTLCLLLADPMTAVTEAEAKTMFRSFNHFSIAAEHGYATVQAGCIYNTLNAYMIMSNISLPFSDGYYISGGLGAGPEANGQGFLSLLDLGLGYRGLWGRSEDLSYQLGVSVKSIRSAAYHSLLLSGEFVVEKKIKSLYLTAGTGFNSQQDDIISTDIYPETEERMFNVMLKIGIRSPYGNLVLKALPGSVSAGVSWTLKLEN